ncbi:hypothetical protein [Kocuria sp. U4B]
MVANNKARIFIPAQIAVAAADAIHDAVEQKNRRTPPMVDRPFYSRPKFWEKTHIDSENVYTKPAVLEGPGGITANGIAVFTNGFLHLTLTVNGAYLLANRLVDAIEHHRKDNAA